MCDSKTTLCMAVAAALAACAGGCSKPSDLAPVQGRVLFNGEPLPYGAVMLQPPSGNPSRATIQPDGSFVLETLEAGLGARVGVNKVRVTCYEVQNPKLQRKSSEDLPLGASLIPRKYTSYASGLTVEIKPDGNEPLLIELTDD